MSSKKIQLIIRDAGLASRRGAEEMIRHRRVTLNGEVVENPAEAADPHKDHIKVDGRLLQTAESAKSYLLFNKPRNVVSTLNDPEGRPCLGDLLKRFRKRLFVVGRLDFDAEGLMILTNDGDLAQKLSHPSHKAPRTYVVKIRGNPEDKQLNRIRKGMSIGDRERIGDVQWNVIRRQKSSTWVKLVLFEGKKNEIKRIFQRIEHPVRKIRRTGFGPFRLGRLPSGTWRDLTESEMRKLAALLRSNKG